MTSLLIALRDLTDVVKATYPNGWTELHMQRTGDLTVNVRSNAVVKHRGCIEATMNQDKAIFELDRIRRLIEEDIKKVVI